MTVFALYVKWMGKHKTGFFLLLISLFSELMKLQNCFYSNAEYKKLTFLKIISELVIPREAISR